METGGTKLVREIASKFKTAEIAGMGITLPAKHAGHYADVLDAAMTIIESDQVIQSEIHKYNRQYLWANNISRHLEEVTLVLASCASLAVLLQYLR